MYAFNIELKLNNCTLKLFLQKHDAQVSCFKSRKNPEVIEKNLF